ncbi:hypothetical protein S7711_05660 [Stachybotrys chartarum IBT 7711]|uniref:Uncharacterized protein n=1 Tax=Stachybotrys chartarum (strain CBS 109288 / IBT 7711) TaxID=1280523 RepID=A0A084B1G8_STACB|nr:hypothetical protein S7711_05660 [Stachybotrys chartarum IBT 7711]
MTRRLPWKRSGVKSPCASPDNEDPRSGASKSETPKPITTRSPRVASSPSIAKRERSALRHSPFHGGRSPSTSPPRGPPPERFMNAGSFSDDQFRMVEDEFDHTAQQFTRHLHHAEYARLKSLAKSQNAATISAIERPVVGRPSAEVQRRKDAAKRAAKQRRALQDAAGDGAGVPWAGTSLQGLMERPTRDFNMIPCSPSKSRTRAAAGHQSSRANAGHNGRESPETRDSTPTRHRGPSRQQERRVDTVIMEMEDGISDDDDPFGIQRRKARREKSREQLRRPPKKTSPSPVSLDDIPSFL